jgi:hypothetical protein
VRADGADTAYNIDALWARIVGLVPEAERARRVRVLSEVRSASGWGSVWTQALNAGRVLRNTLAGRDDQTK